MFKDILENQLNAIKFKKKYKNATHKIEKNKEFKFFFKSILILINLSFCK